MTMLGRKRSTGLPRGEKLCSPIPATAEAITCWPSMIRDTAVGNAGKDAVEWSKTGAATVLDWLPRAKMAVADDINKAGAVAGSSFVNGQWSATYWSAAGVVQNLHTVLGPAWRDTFATGINNAGDICGYGSDNGVGSAFELLWAPRPARTAWSITPHIVTLEERASVLGRPRANFPDVIRPLVLLKGGSRS